VPVGPLLQFLADELRAVVTTQPSRFATPFDNLIQRLDHAYRRQREVGLNAQSLTVEVIQHIEQSERTTICQLVMHEVHGPDRVRYIRHDQRLWLFPLNVPLWLDAQIQLQPTANPLDTLVVPVKAFDVTQIIPAQTKAPASLVMRQPN
jgi:hypothetical protein